jgi:ribosomal-protein-alanine N-acetyltransferase
VQVRLRPLAAGDRDEFLELVRASRRLHLPWTAPPSDRAAFARYLERNTSPDFEALLACRMADGRIVGAFNLSQIFHGLFRNAYLGHWVGEPFAGQGYMSEGLRLTLRRAFGPLKLHRLEANIQPGNAPSIALVKRAGFRLEGFSPRYLKINGRWRDHERWAITSEDLRSNG